MGPRFSTNLNGLDCWFVRALVLDGKKLPAVDQVVRMMQASRLGPTRIGAQ